MRISHLLDLPSVSLSSGQTRRARIAAALLTRPALLLLQEPMAGLDIASRAEVSRILDDLNQQGEIRVVLVLRGKGGALPDWVTDVVDVRQGNAWVGSKAQWQAERNPGSPDGRMSEEGHQLPDGSTHESSALSSTKSPGREPVVQLQDVSVSYGEGSRPVLKNVTWEIRPGDKWHLQGANGKSHQRCF